MENIFRLSEDGKTLLEVLDSNVEEIIIPEGVTSIGDNAFCGCSSLQNLSIPEGVTYFEGIVEDENEEDITEDSFDFEE